MSANRIGGRVRTKKNFGDGVTIEDAANWIYEEGSGSNAIYQLANQYGVSNQLARIFDLTTYEYDPTSQNSGATKVDPEVVADVFRQFREGPFQEVLDYTDALWEEEVTEDRSVMRDLQQNGWDPSDPLQFAAKWTWINYEHAIGDISHYAAFDVYGTDSHFIDDQNTGYEGVVQRYARDNGVNPVFDRRVNRIEYDNSGEYNARVYTTDSSGACYAYDAKRVILTVSTGVLNKNLIEFDPPLRYPAPRNNPMEMHLYVKIFYQFENKFWDDTDYVLTLKDRGNNENGGSLCSQWQNVDNYIPNSRILMCTLTTPEWVALVGEAQRDTATLSNGQLLDLLEPLRHAYPDTFAEPIHMYYPPINKDRDFGFGAYGDWKVGFTPWDYYRFYGGGSNNVSLFVWESRTFSIVPLIFPSHILLIMHF